MYCFTITNSTFKERAFQSLVFNFIPWVKYMIDEKYSVLYSLTEYWADIFNVK